MTDDNASPSTDVVPKVFDGTLVDEVAAAGLSNSSDGRISTFRALVKAASGVVVWMGVTVGSLAGRAWRSEVGRRIRLVVAYRVHSLPRDVVRLFWFVVRGHGRWIGKAWTWFTYGDLRADARAARLSGDAEARRAAQEAIRGDSRTRWARWGVFAHRVAVATGVTTGLALSLLLLNMIMSREDMWPWLATVYRIVEVTGRVLGDIGPWLILASLVGWIVAAAFEGRDKSPGAGWLIRPDRDDAGSWVDERMISRALAHLGISPLNQFFKGGGELAYTVPARRDGDGTFAQVRLPLGVTADMVAARRSKLAANLGRASLETWPTKSDEDGVLDLWVADKGVLSSGAGDWPLLTDGTVDVFDGVPFGLSQRGVIINAPLIGVNWLIGGRPGQGKTAAMRTLLLGATLDPTAELWVFVLGESSDFEPFAPRLARYQMGMDDRVAEAATRALHDLLTEMERRGRALGEQPGRPPKVSRKLADRAALGLHPLICAIDECHELFQHPTFGKRAAELAVRLVKRGRKYGIVLMLATQSPTKDSIPREITRNISCGVAFSVSDQVANDGLLGSGKYAAGIRATELRINTDRGTCVAVGITDETFELVRTFYIPFEDGADDVSPVIARAIDQMRQRRRTIVPAFRPQLSEQAPVVDPLADVAEVMDHERRVRTHLILSRLAQLNPNHYERWTFRDLRQALDPYHVQPVKSDGYKVLRVEDITAALAARGRDDDRDLSGTQGQVPALYGRQNPCSDQPEQSSGTQGTRSGDYDDNRPNSALAPGAGGSLPDRVRAADDH